MGDSYIMNGVKSLFRFHWGSVVAGSFLLNFFYIPDLVYDFLKPNENNRGCYKCFTTVCCCCDRFFGFARSDAMAFINAVGLPYCNSSRWCEKINYLSSYFDGSQSIFRVHLLLFSISVQEVMSCQLLLPLQQALYTRMRQELLPINSLYFLVLPSIYLLSHI